jgi:GT2 family glycosyltransferase
MAEGLTVVVASWNTRKYLEVFLEAIYKFTTKDFNLIIVDNHSADGSPEYLREYFPDVTVYELRRNVGHGLAIDYAIHKACTNQIVVLDIDAFPISHDWLRILLEPLNNGATLVGAEHCGYVHPCYMALHRDFFLKNKHTFDAVYTRKLRIRKTVWPKFWDAGQLITERDDGYHHYIPPTSVRGPHALGVVFGHVVYHNFYSTQSAGGQVTKEQSDQAWQEAIDKYLRA